MTEPARNHTYRALRRTDAEKLPLLRGEARAAADHASEERTRPAHAAGPAYTLTGETVDILAGIGEEMAQRIERAVRHGAQATSAELTRQEIRNSVRYYEQLRDLPVPVQEDPGIWVYLTVATLGEPLIAAGRTDPERHTLVDRHLGVHRAGDEMARRMYNLGRLITRSGQEGSGLDELFRSTEMSNYQEMVSSHIFATTVRHQPGFQTALLPHLATLTQKDGRTSVAQQINPVRLTIAAERYSTADAAQLIRKVQKDLRGTP